MLVNLAAAQPTLTTPHQFEQKLQVIEYPDGEKFVDEMRSYDEFGIEKTWTMPKEGETRHKMFLLKHDHPYHMVSEEQLQEIVSGFEKRHPEEE